MQRGAIVDDVELRIVVTVQVERHTEFCDNLRSRALETARRWNEENVDGSEATVEE